MSRNHLFPVLSCLLLTLLSVTSLPAAERRPVPTPPGGGPGTHLALPDIALPGRGGSPTGREEEIPRLLPREWPTVSGGGAKGGEIGGDDVLVTVADFPLFDCSMDIASDGTIYLANEQIVSSSMWCINIYRSRDGGDTWEGWAIAADPADGMCYHPSLVVAEGTVDRCFLAYCYSPGPGQPHEIHVAWKDLSAPPGDFDDEMVVMQETDSSFDFPCLASDAGSFSAYYLYLVARRTHGTASDIWFARSIDQGTSFESGYAIATVTGDDRTYTTPVVCYGYGGYVHVAWQFASRDGSFDSATRHRRASNYASGGLSAWGDIHYLTGTWDGVWECDQRIAASLGSQQVLIAFSRQSPENHLAPPGVMVSTDGGDSFGAPVVLEGLQAGTVEGLEYQPSSGDWILASRYYAMGLLRASEADPTNWSPAACLADSFYHSAYSHRDALALDPSHGYRAAAAWSSSLVEGTYNNLAFDAEWRDDPGYPNLEDGFPVPLSVIVTTSPIVADIDGDGKREILFGDYAGQINVYRYDGSVQPGWPVDVGLKVYGLAVGSLDGHQTVIVAGSADGRVYAYRSDGTPVPGWPYNTGTGSPTYVSIGAVGGPYPRTVVVCSGDEIHWVGEHGTPPPATAPWYGLGGNARGPAAIGDVDGDGVSEAVAAFGGNVVAVRMRPSAFVMDQDIDHDIAGPVSLADLDADGDVEILVPTDDGLLVALQGDGTPLGGSWPFVSPTGSYLTSAAVADCVGSPEPEIAVADIYDGSIHLLSHDGEEQPGYPVHNNGDDIYAGPVIGLLEGSSPDVVSGSAEPRAWAWDASGQLVHGWPKHVDGYAYGCPAMGDLDGDGRTEVVLVTASHLVALDVNMLAGTPQQTWAMDRHDPQRTGCADCPEDLTTGVSDDGTATVTRVRFAPPTPSPGPGPQQFAFALPVRARVRLDVYDLRGALVRSLHRAEMAPGWHTVGWDGRDDAGHPVASGQYLARLQVRGPGVDVRLVRKLVIAR